MPHLPVAGHALEQLTDDHRIIVSSEQTYLGRALGINPQIEIDYQAIRIENGDVFLLATDGVYEHVDARFVVRAVNENAGDLDAAAKLIVEEAYRQGSEDNITVQIVRIDAVCRTARPATSSAQTFELPPPPLLERADGVRRLPDRPGDPWQQPKPHLPGASMWKPMRRWR